MISYNDQLLALVQAALKEDIGDGDHSTLASIPADAHNRAHLLVKDAGVLAGVELAQYIFREVDPEMTVATLFGTISQTTMSTTLSYLMLNEKPADACVIDDKLKLRLKDHLKDLMRAHLTPQK